MNTCLTCAHWQPKAGDASMARMGFAPCDKNALAGHTTSASRASCNKFAPLDADKAAKRRAWMEKTK